MNGDEATPARWVREPGGSGGPGDVELAVWILTEAFSTDPFVHWIAPSDPARLFAPLVADCAAAGTLDLLGDVAAAAWLPVLAGARTDSGDVPPDLPDRMRAFLELVDARHPMERDHLHLQFLGARPGHRGSGAGSTLLARGLAWADRTGQPAYLEASSPRNVALYERHAFTALGDPITLPDGPTLWPMWREPRPLT